MNHLCKNLLAKSYLARLGFNATRFDIQNQSKYLFSTLTLSNFQSSQPNKLKSESLISSGTTVRYYLSQTDKNNSTAEKADYTSKSKNGFSVYNLHEKLLERMKILGYTTPFEIQEATLKHTLAGKDVVGKAFTGSGKTLAFAIPIINKIYNSKKRNRKSPKCLVLSPTRELCLQLTNSINELAPELNCVSVFGGVSIRKQVKEIEKHVDIVCATPGRLMDIIQHDCMNTDQIEIVCVDEADELLGKFFLPQIEYLIEKSSTKKQLLMFSATINDRVMQLINNYMNDPVVIDLTDGDKHKLPTNIEHFIAKADIRSIPNVVKHLMDEYKSERCLIFTNTKFGASNLAAKLQCINIKSCEFYSGKDQRKRIRILDSFRSGKYQAIVATDVAARGIDIPEIDLIIHVESPRNGLHSYIHRSGRTGRAGRPGRSVIINTGFNDKSLGRLEQMIEFKNIQLPEDVKNVDPSIENFVMYRDSSIKRTQMNFFKKNYNFHNGDDKDDKGFRRKDFGDNNGGSEEVNRQREKKCQQRF